VASLLRQILVLRERELDNCPALDEKEIQQCMTIFQALLQNKQMDTSQLESSLERYLATYPHHFESLSSGKFSPTSEYFVPTIQS